MSTGRVLAIFSLRLAALLFVAFVGMQLVPYRGFFPGKELLESFDFPQILYSWANFDGVHYISIAQIGYVQYEQAFFPLYPLLVRAVGTALMGNYLLSGLLISNIAFLTGLFVWVAFVKSIDKKLVTPATAYLLFFPTAFFFSAVYTESVFFLLVVTSLLLMQKKKLLLAALVAALASSTRLMGVFLVIPLGVKLYQEWKRNTISTKGAIVIACIPCVGLGAYMLYLYRTVGDPLFFFTAQPAFGANRSTSLVLLPQVIFRYLKIFIVSTRDASYLTALVEFSLFLFTFIVLCFDAVKLYVKKNYFLLSISAFSIINILLPTLTGTLSSTPRYALMSISVYLFLAREKGWVPKITLFVFIPFQILLTMLFIQGYFIG